ERDDGIAETGADHRPVLGDSERGDEEQDEKGSDRKRHGFGNPQNHRECHDREAGLRVRLQRDQMTRALERGGTGKGVHAQHERDGGSRDPRSAVVSPQILMLMRRGANRRRNRKLVRHREADGSSTMASALRSPSWHASSQYSSPSPRRP